MSKAKSRPPQVHELEIDASPEDVWNAISTPEGMTRWYAESARVDPKVGGENWVSWGEGQDVGNTNLVWEPGKHLKTGHPDHATAEGFDAMVTDWEIETRKGKTVLKLVQSGLPDGPEWDSMDEGTKVGWQMFLHGLKFYLEHHLGQSRRTIMRNFGSKGPVAQTFDGVRALLGIHAGDLQTGKKYAATTQDGEKLSGTIVATDGSQLLLASVDQLEGALISVSVHGTGEGAYVNFMVGTFGLSDPAFDEAKARWSKLQEQAR